MTTLDNYFTTRGAGNILGWTSYTVWRHCKSGYLKGTGYLILDRDLRDFIADGKFKHKSRPKKQVVMQTCIGSKVLTVPSEVKK
jgi:hypothetical protein